MLQRINQIDVTGDSVHIIKSNNNKYFPPIAPKKKTCCGDIHIWCYNTTVHASKHVVNQKLTLFGCLKHLVRPPLPYHGTSILTSTTSSFASRAARVDSSASLMCVTVIDASEGVSSGPERTSSQSACR